MECGKLTAKLRDAVPVCFLVEGKEIKRYKNIEVPDELKRLEYQDFTFDVPVVGAITFKIAFAAGVLPDPMPGPRGLKSRKPVTEEPTDLPQAISTAPTDVVPQAQEERQPADTISEIMGIDDSIAVEVTEASEGDHKASIAGEPEIMEITYHVTGERRKELVKAIGQFTGITATFQNAPAFAYAIGDYTVDKGGTLTGENNAALVQALAEQGFIAD
jgi:hypothetical protein